MTAKQRQTSSEEKECPIGGTLDNRMEPGRPALTRTYYENPERERENTTELSERKRYIEFFEKTTSNLFQSEPGKPDYHLYRITSSVALVRHKLD